MRKSLGEMYDAIVKNLKGKTGRTAEEWLALVKAEGPEEKSARIAWPESKRRGSEILVQKKAYEADGA